MRTGKEAISGELLVSGPFLADGYYHNPSKTSEAFVQNPLNDAYPEVVYRTGDLVYRGEDGLLRYQGRKDFQIKHMGTALNPVKSKLLLELYRKFMPAYVFT